MKFSFEVGSSVFTRLIEQKPTSQQRLARHLPQLSSRFRVTGRVRQPDRRAENPGEVSSRLKQTCITNHSNIAETADALTVTSKVYAK